MIVEIIGVPGSGKTFLAEKMANTYGYRYQLLKGFRGGLNLRELTSRRYFLIWLVKKVTQLISCFLMPIMLLLFFKFFYRFALAVFLSKKPEISDLRNYFYQLFALSYQFLRYHQAKSLAALTGKTVLIDEGLVYSYIRFMTLTRNNISKHCQQQLLERVISFADSAVILRFDPEKALAQFLEREKLNFTSDIKYKLRSWKFISQDSNQWIIKSWYEMDRWVNEVKSSKISTILLEIDAEHVHDTVTQLHAKLNEVKHG